ncbi:hypothetical protein V6N12_037162 [Hibiscus sabdariffa]|uniref:Uncharacterized protein n=1 Tax=Hibiscus sabdariffa TaxID=183260 RepID=A0ABR1ZL03_9ROSI
MILVKVEESEDDEIESAKGSARKGRSWKPGRDSVEKKEPVTPSSDRPTREEKSWKGTQLTNKLLGLKSSWLSRPKLSRLPVKLTKSLCPLSLICFGTFFLFMSP